MTKQDFLTNQQVRELLIHLLNRNNRERDGRFNEYIVDDFIASQLKEEATHLLFRTDDSIEIRAGDLIHCVISNNEIVGIIPDKDNPERKITKVFST